jgi:hypothetical protein
MARIETRLAKTLYFCNVKNRMRHVVAAECSVFRATNLVEKLYPNECGSSNAHKGSAFGTLTARIGVLLCLKFMETNAKKLQDAQLETVESIQEYLNNFHSVAELYERTGKALAEIIHASNHLSEEAKKLIGDMVDDHICLLDLVKPLEEKGGEV